MTTDRDAADPEAQFAPPAAWIPMKHPRRGGFATRVKPVDPEAGELLNLALEKNAQALQWAQWELVNNTDPNDFVIAARGYLEGKATPIGAAAAFVILTRVIYDTSARDAVVADGWVARYGLPFAVEAMMRASNLGHVTTRVPVPEGGTYIQMSVGGTDDSWRVRDPNATRYMMSEQLGELDNPDAQIATGADDATAPGSKRHNDATPPGDVDVHPNSYTRTGGADIA